MRDKIISILGVPIHNMTKEETVDRILELIDEFSKNKKPNFITSVSTHFLVHSNNWNPGGVKNQEMFHILRTSAIVTAESWTTSLLCRILNYPLKEKIRGSDLILPLSKALGKKQMSIFILGGDTNVTQKAVKKLWDQCPGLEIVGTACPEVSIHGENLVSADTLDNLILEQIDEASPDVLFVSFGNPKQEIWFERVQRHLNVPVTVGIGRVLEPLSGNKLVQWWKRKVTGTIKLLYMATPLVIYHKISRLVYSLMYKEKQNQKVRNEILLFLSPEKSIAIIRFPPLVHRNVYEQLKQKIDDAFTQDITIIDFRAVRHLDLSGIALLLTTWMRSREDKKELYGLNMKGDVKQLLRLHRIWHLIEEDICQDPREIMARLCREGSRSVLFESINQQRSHVILTFFGQLDYHKDYGKYLKRLLPIIHGKHCILDFTYCTYIDNRGFNFLLKLRNYVLQEKKKAKICGVTGSIKQSFQTAKVLELFSLYPNQNAALWG